MDASKLEPAERNFKREVLTLIVILVVAFGAGIVILYNYIQTRTRQTEEQNQGRSPEMGELVKNYSFKNKEDEESSFFDYAGKITLVACISVDQLDDSKLVIDALKRFDELYKDCLLYTSPSPRDA